MIVDIRLISLRDYLRTNLIGAIDFEVSKVALTEMVKASSAVGVPNLFVDTRMAIPVGLDASDVHELVKHLLSLEIDPGIRIAILNDPRDELDRSKLFEEYARESGIEDAVFRDYESAITWLCQLPRNPVDRRLSN
jgi:hypothetical protein